LGLALEKPKKDEKPAKIDGLDLLVSDMVKNIADGSLVDYVSSIYGEQFIIRANYSC
jgi:Fe-S cluster assembly iron-binding protein IscA